MAYPTLRSALTATSSDTLTQQPADQATPAQHKQGKPSSPKLRRHAPLPQLPATDLKIIFRPGGQHTTSELQSAVIPQPVPIKFQGARLVQDRFQIHFKKGPPQESVLLLSTPPWPENPAHRTTVRRLCDELDSIIGCQRASGLSTERKVLCVLRFFGTGSFRRSVGREEQIGMAQPAASNTIQEVCNSELCILVVDLRLPDSGHDSWIWQHNPLCTRLAAQLQPGESLLVLLKVHTNVEGNSPGPFDGHSHLLLGYSGSIAAGLVDLLLPPLVDRFHNGPFRVQHVGQLLPQPSSVDKAEARPQLAGFLKPAGDAAP
ncbi:hypothetical protein HPB49_003925 [Dermacentor silvarum]|uniref:Uncharacterized protein n=1 Tax=Dermacentor silvarum TaxID=543639 RepID=A0ACB8C786_DERSI|nr:hypothetical protein HPB49_003925 [Dermacentor silvarum]